MKLYLAHPLEMRKEIREMELYVETETTVDLINPFYDVNRPEIERMDKMGYDRTNAKFLNSVDEKKLVTKDLMLVESCNGVIAYVNSHYHSIGTICEIWHGFKHGKVVYILTPNCSHHPWLRFAVGLSKGEFFKSMDEFITWCEKNYKKEVE